ncbi:ribosome biogenesis factor YjgA [Candidatus Williamhamiltonella defendens]|uniref:ribosome biogenesis factor YjgA n=1 Tax=Candidatus Williamhamiltonella defendens TaxID=138072 RepID=UPI00130E76C9|nr:ribosome biogenesis factor YjgA [Candidatus Hamiltonella defensa]
MNRNEKFEHGLNERVQRKNNYHKQSIIVSKSELKRDAEALKKLGRELIGLSKQALKYIPLDTDLLAAIELAQKIKKEGYRRQIQLIGKMLRSRQEQLQSIKTALNERYHCDHEDIVLLHQLENLRDSLLEKGDRAIVDLLQLYPLADRQHIRSLIRNAQKEKAADQSPKALRQIFEYLRLLSKK